MILEQAVFVCHFKICRHGGGKVNRNMYSINSTFCRKLYTIIFIPPKCKQFSPLLPSDLFDNHTVILLTEHS